MANLNTQPQSVNLSLTRNQQYAFSAGWLQKFVPKNVDGTIFDCTGLVGATLAVIQPTLTSSLAEVSAACTVGTADATGVVLSMTPAQADSLFAQLNNTNLNYSIVATDGTNLSIVGKGSLQVNMLP